jgi:uncharacterized protein with FMN-binding domain
MQSSNKTTPIIVGTLASASIIGTGVYVFTTGQQKIPDTTSAPVSSVTKNTSDTLTSKTNADSTLSITTKTTDTTPVSTAVKDGTYSATANYSVPHGWQNNIKVTVTISGGAISTVSADHDYSDQESGYYIDSFDADISATVSGDTLSDAYAGRVGGASLTSSAFNDALQTILSEAQT